jgi:DNA-binding helix-hairpin-helix protein with protein kinase domain
MCPCCHATAYLKPQCLLFAVSNRDFIFSPQEAITEWVLQARLAEVKAFYRTGRDQQRAVAACESRWYAQHGKTDPMHISAVRHFICHNVHKLEWAFALSTLQCPCDPEWGSEVCCRDIS